MRGWSSRVGRSAASLVGLLVLIGVFAPSASAVLVHLAKGQVAGVAPVKRVSPASIPGSFAKRGAAATKLSSNGNLDYNGGPVLHSSAPYLVFWDPGSQISAGDKALFERYLADVAADSGKATNVYSVDRQYTDSTGLAAYNQTWTLSHAITDTQPYPASGQCAVHAFSETTCLFDSQLQAEASRLIAADGLPTGITGNAPIYLLVTPPTVNSCFDSPQQTTCADNQFCAYHSSYSDSGNTVLYADIPTVLAANAPKGCQADNTTPVQQPNGNQIVDVAIKYLSHEDNETITDPLGNAWWDTATGNEDGDNCNFTGSFAPGNGYNPNAFLPTLGGSASGTLYDQLINSDRYYIQSEWSNGDVNCEMHPAAGAIVPSFTAPSTANPGASVSFNPGASTSSQGYTSVTWDFGDGSTSFSPISATPPSVNHSFASRGVYTVTLTLVDKKGNLATVTHQLTVGAPAASFTFLPAAPAVGQSVSFDGSGSSDPNAGGSVTSYVWNFGDGSAAGSGASPTHVYANPGTYTVSLVVTDNYGLSSTMVTHQVTVGSPPAASFTFLPAAPAVGQSVSFDGGGSSESNSGGSVTSYAWNFGDGSPAGSGSTPTHEYASPGTYTVSLVVTDNYGLSSGSVSHQVTVLALPTPAFSVATGTPAVGHAVSFDGRASSDPNGGSIVAYAWSFGDGSPAVSGSTPIHAYASPGTYTVSLTVTDSEGGSATVSHQVRVDGLPKAAFAVQTGHPASGIAVQFSGGSSSSPNGSIISYTWSFGDGSTSGSGVSRKHTFKRADTYTVTLTVTDSAGLTASVSHSVRVASAATITNVSITKHKGSELVVLKFSGPGVLTVAGKRYEIRKAGTTKVPIKLTHGQRTQLRKHHQLKLKLKITFVPSAGATFAKTETLTLKT